MKFAFRFETIEYWVARHTRLIWVNANEMQNQYILNQMIISLCIEDVQNYNRYGKKEQRYLKRKWANGLFDARTGNL